MAAERDLIDLSVITMIPVMVMNESSFVVSPLYPF